MVKILCSSNGKDVAFCYAKVDMWQDTETCHKKKHVAGLGFVMALHPLNTSYWKHNLSHVFVHFCILLHFTAFYCILMHNRNCPPGLIQMLELLLMLLLLLLLLYAFYHVLIWGREAPPYNYVMNTYSRSSSSISRSNSTANVS